MNRAFKKFSICSIILLGILGTNAQMSISASSRNNKIPDTSALIGHYNHNSLQHTTKDKQDIARVVLQQQREAIINNSNHIRKQAPNGLNKEDKQYYWNLVNRNDALMQQERQFAQIRQQYHYPEVATNTRDIGGYITTNREFRVKPDKLIRSNNLHNLTPQGATFLKEQLHVNNIIDLRNNTQINRKPDADEDIHDYIIYNPANTHLNVKFHDDSVYNQRMAKRTNHKVSKYGTDYRYKNLYSTDKQAKKAYNKAFHQILNDKNGTVLYHCIEGRDRTGITSILLLSALHVPRATIIKDYLLTNYYMPRYLFTDQLNNINTFYGTVQDEYGSIDNYLDSIGVNKHQRTILQKRYLEPINSSREDSRNINNLRNRKYIKKNKYRKNHKAYQKSCKPRYRNLKARKNKKYISHKQVNKSYFKNNKNSKHKRIVNKKSNKRYGHKRNIFAKLVEEMHW